MPSESATANKSTKTSPDPVIIEVGRRGKDQINKLRQGRGPIRRDIDSVLGQLRESGDLAQDAQVVIVVVRQQRRPKAGSNCLWPW
jgi:hypothetical protein